MTQFTNPKAALIGKVLGILCAIGLLLLVPIVGYIFVGGVAVVWLFALMAKGMFSPAFKPHNDGPYPPGVPKPPDAQ